MAAGITIDIQKFIKSLRPYLEAAQSTNNLYIKIVNAPFEDSKNATLLGLGIVVLLLVNNETGMIDRVALSDTEQAKGAVSMSVKPFKSIKIPVGHLKNKVAEAIASGKSQVVTDWRYLFNPSLTAEEARFNQAGAAISCSIVQPLQINSGGALIFSYYLLEQEITPSHYSFMRNYAKLIEQFLK